MSPAPPALLRAGMEAAGVAALQGPRGANPLVGAALLDAAGRLVAVDHHRGAGTPHAEAALLARLPELDLDPASATMLVTLEPCRHRGRTGPCTRAIIEAGIPRVVYALADPHAPAAGGAEELRAAGVQVTHQSDLLDLDLNPRWLRSIAEDRPFVTLKIAQSLDGMIAAADGTSQWITGPEARAHGQRLRQRVDAILVGTGTALADDPALTARDRSGRELDRQPLRVVMGHRRLPETARLLSGPAPAWQTGSRDPLAVLAGLRERGIGHLMVEGGPSAAAAFLEADLVDELWLHQAPVLIPGGIPALAGTAAPTLARAIRWRPDPADEGPLRTLGDDLWWHLQPSP